MRRRATRAVLMRWIVLIGLILAVAWPSGPNQAAAQSSPPAQTPPQIPRPVGVPRLPSAAAGWIEGSLEVVHFDDFQHGQSWTEYILHTSSGPVRLHFDGRAPDVLTRSTVRVKNRPPGPDGAVTIQSTNADFQVVSAATVAPGVKKVAVLLFNFQNNPIQPFTTDQIRSDVFTNTNAPNAYYKEISWNKTSLTGKVRSDGDVYGWYTIPYNTGGTCTAADGDTWRQAADAAAQAAGVDLTGYDNRIYVLPTNSACPWGGTAQIGGPFSWNNGYPSTNVFGHELGHNFGAHHASTYHCVDGNGTPVTISNSCSIDEYGDGFDIMGTNVDPVPPHHMSSFHKGQLGLLNAANTETVSEAGTYTIAPQEMLTSTGVQVLRIPRAMDSSGVSTYYYLEFRQTYGQYDSFSAGAPVTQGVSIRIAPPYFTSTEAYLLDTTPDTSTFDDSALAVGRAFLDPAYGVSITTNSVSPSGASVSVNFTGGNCPHANPSVAVSPVSQDAASGQSLTYDVTVTNHDDSSCHSDSFTLAGSLPSGWTQSPTAQTLTMLPGGSATAAVTVTPPPGLPPGSYSIGESAVNATNAAYTGSAAATFNSVSSLTVTTSADAASCPNGSGNAGYSLRCAITAANAGGQPVIIRFAIPATDSGCAATTISSVPRTVCTISPTSPLPALTGGRITIDGFSQSGAAPGSNRTGSPPNPIITVRLAGGTAGTSASGVTVSGAGDTIKGLSITAFSGNGIDLTGSSASVQGNLIGVSPTGTPTGNGGNGVYAHDGATGQIGAASPANADIIANNGKSGVLIGASTSDSTTRIAVRGNAIFGNAGLALDLAPQGTVDCSPVAGGPNGGTPCPSIGSATTSLVNGSACSSCIVDLYLVGSPADASGHGQAQRYLGTTTADANGNWTIVPPAGLSDSQYVTATATAPVAGIWGTSEMADNVRLPAISVTTTQDFPTCTVSLSLRCALATAGPSTTIRFHIPASDPGCTGTPAVCTTIPTSPLPWVQGAGMLIDGYSQPGAHPATHALRHGDDAKLTVRINGVGAGSVDGFYVVAPNVTIRGLMITSYAWGAVRVDGSANTGLKVQGCFLGTDGTNAMGNGSGVIFTSGAGSATVGGTGIGEGNLISSSNNASINVFGGSGNVYQGNLFGTDASGTRALPNAHGIFMGYGASNMLVGGSVLGAGNIFAGGNQGYAVWINGDDHITVQGNIMGLDVGGQNRLGVYAHDIEVEGNATNTLIGGTTPAAANVISGGYYAGVHVYQSSGTTIEGNLIGTDTTGLAPAWSGYGIFVEASSTNTTIGGTAHGAGNLISFNGTNIYETTASNTLIEGNTIGPAADGTALPSVYQAGISLSGGSAVTLGGTAPGAGNLIADYYSCGLCANSVSGITVQGNTFDGHPVAIVGGSFDGIDIAQGPTTGIIGGTSPGAANTFLHNQRAVSIGSPAGTSGIHVAVEGNSMKANTGLGIDLYPYDTVDCTTSPPGPNDYTPCPIIAGATTALVSGTACHGCTVEVFLATADGADQGHGEGSLFLARGTADATTGAFSIPVSGGQVGVGALVTATATTPSSLGPPETSEFAQNVAAGAANTMNVAISQGWNLLDVPLQTTYGSFAALAGALNNSLGSGATSALAVYRNGSFALYVPGYSADSPIGAAEGFFALSRAAGSWHVAGSAYTLGQAVTLSRGWNLVSAPFPSGGLAATAIAKEIDATCAIKACSVKEIATYSAGAYITYVPGGGGNSFQLPASSAVWILMNVPALWTPT